MSTTAAAVNDNPKPILAIGQMCSTSDHEHNLETCRKLCIQAKDKGAALLSLPECFEYMGTPGTGDSLAAAQPLEGLNDAKSSRDVGGALFSRYRQLAKEHGIWLSLGGNSKPWTLNPLDPDPQTLPKTLNPKP